MSINTLLSFLGSGLTAYGQESDRRQIDNREQDYFNYWKAQQTFSRDSMLKTSERLSKAKIPSSPSLSPYAGLASLEPLKTLEEQTRDMFSVAFEKTKALQERTIQLNNSFSPQDIDVFVQQNIKETTTRLRTSFSREASEKYREVLTEAKESKSMSPYYIRKKLNEFTFDIQAQYNDNLNQIDIRNLDKQFAGVQLKIDQTQNISSQMDIAIQGQEKITSITQDVWGTSVKNALSFASLAAMGKIQEFKLVSASGRQEQQERYQKMMSVFNMNAQAYLAGLQTSNQLAMSGQQGDRPKSPWETVGQTFDQFASEDLSNQGFSWDQGTSDYLFNGANTGTNSSATLDGVPWWMGQWRI